MIWTKHRPLCIPDDHILQILRCTCFCKDVGPCVAALRAPPPQWQRAPPPRAPACSSPPQWQRPPLPHTRIDITEEQDAWIIRSAFGTKRDSERERYTKCEDLKNCACAGTRLDVNRGQLISCNCCNLPMRTSRLKAVPSRTSLLVQRVPQSLLPGVHRRVYEQERL